MTRAASSQSPSTSTGETGFPLDAHGEATYESIAWFDGRTKAEAQWLDEHIGADRLFAITGLSLQPIFSLCKILWLRKHAPEPTPAPSAGSTPPTLSPSACAVCRQPTARSRRAC